MAKFCGKVGFAKLIESVPGVWVDSIETRTYRGDMILDQRRWQGDDKVNDELNIDNKVSIVADPYFYENLGNIKYVELIGTKWKVQTITINRPRVMIYLGGMYNGQQN